MSFLFGDSGASDAAEQARRDEQRRQAEIRRGTKQINEVFGKQFNDQFYSGQTQNYLNFARPQIEDQYGDARRELTFALARGGIGQSSAAGAKAADLYKLRAEREREAADQARGYANNTRSAVEQARSDLINTLNVTGDASGAAANALNRANVVSAPPVFSPLGQMFSSFTQGLGQQVALERGAYYGGPAPRYDTGIGRMVVR